MKKHEAIEADVSSYRERIQAVAELALEVEAENYYDAKRVAAQRDNVLRQWGLLSQLLRARRARLEQHLALQRVFQEMVYMIDWMEEMQVMGGGPTSGYGGSRWDMGGPNGKWEDPMGYGDSQWDTMGYRGSRWDMGVPMGYNGIQGVPMGYGGPSGIQGVPMGDGGSQWDVGCPGLHDRLDGGDAGAGGWPHFGMRGVPMGYKGSQWEMGGPDGIQGVPMGYGGSRST